MFSILLKSYSESIQDTSPKNPEKKQKQNELSL